MTKEEEKERKNDDKVNELKNHICYGGEEKPYVFISYKSDDWKIVLRDVVYRLWHDYGLNFYFDGAFDGKNPLWTKQFPENMSHPDCKGVLAFVDQKYSTSYATLLELMYSQTVSGGEKPVVTVNLGKFPEIKSTNRDANIDTGLGDDSNDDDNNNAEKEVELFDDTYSDLIDAGVITGKAKGAYKPYKNKKLTHRECNIIVRHIIGNLEIQKNKYEKGDSLEDLVNTIKSAFEGDVFGSKISQPPKVTLNTKSTDLIAAEPTPNEAHINDTTVKQGNTANAEAEKENNRREADTISGRISISDFLKNWSSDKNSKNKKYFTGKSYESVRLVGSGECAKYSTESFKSSREMTINFVNRRIDEMGIEYIEKVNRRYSGSSNPPFLPTEEADKKSLSYKALTSSKAAGYSINTNFSEYNFIKELQRYIEALVLPAGELYLEFKDSRENNDITTDTKPTDLTAAEPARFGTDISETKAELSNTVIRPRPLYSGEKENDLRGADKISGRISISDFLKNWSSDKNSKNKKYFTGKSYKSVRLVGSGECAKYSTESFKSSREMTINFVNRRIDEMGIEYIEKVNRRYPGSNNPPFLPTEEADKKSLSYKALTSSKAAGYSINTNFSEYNFIKELQRYIEALVLPAGELYLEFTSYE